MDLDALAYVLMEAVAENMNEKNDCAVRAVAIISGKPYIEIHRIFTRCGRRHRGRIQNYITRLILAHLGIRTVPVVFKGKTIRTLARNIPRKGCYLVWTSGHVLAIKDGKVCDLTEGRLHRVQNIDKVL